MLRWVKKPQFGSSGEMWGFQDVALLVEKLPNLVHQHVVEDEEFTHLDFGIAVNAVKLIYEKVLDVMKEYWQTLRTKEDHWNN